jgi:hypothetical protein
LIPDQPPDGPILNFAALNAAGRLVTSEECLSAAAGQQEALLMPLRENRFGICVDPTPRGGWSKIRLALRPEVRRHRFRFRFAHELAHTLFYDRSGDKPRRLHSAGPEEEAFCDEFARALLVPAGAVTKRPPTAASLLALHRDYDVSVEVAARAMAASHPELNVALWFKYPDGDWSAQWSNIPAEHAAPARRAARVVRERHQAVAVWATDELAP